MTSVPSAVANSTSNTVPVNQSAQRGAAKVSLGDRQIPAVGVTDVEGTPRPQPSPVPPAGITVHIDSGTGAPTVPDMNGVLFRSGPIDSHYLSEIQGHDPYAKVNNPPTRGMVSWIKGYVNGIAQSQNVTATGWNNRKPQQRTSFMRITDIDQGIGYVGGEQFTPHQMAQTPNTRKLTPAVGTDPPGAHILNTSVFGAGQTAGGVGGQQYTPSPGPPPTTEANGGGSSMPTWG